MVTKKDIAVAILATFCLTSTLFMVMPTRSQTETPKYDQWVDFNDDGIIDIFDIAKLALAFGAEGTSINKTALILELEARVDSLNSSLLGLEAYLTTRITTLEATVAQQQSAIAGLETELAVLKATKLGQPDYDSGWVNLGKDGDLHLEHDLNTTNVIVYMIGNDTTNGWAGINQCNFGASDAGAWWMNLNSTHIEIVGCYVPSVWGEVRVMIWKIQQP